MPDYKNGKIYCIRSHQTEQIYIGSTTQTLAERLGGHRKSIKHSYRTSQHILQYPDAYIELIELFPCNSKEELNKKEGEHIRSNNCVNKIIAGRTKIEWREQTKEQKTEYDKHHYEKNKEEIREKHRQHYEKNKEEIREKHRQYYEKNKTKKKLSKE